MNLELNTDKELQCTIAGYARISVDIEKESDKNISIENQIDFIEEYVSEHFPKCELLLYTDRDRSGYTFEQRESYQDMRPLLMGGQIKILIVKDFSRFARRNSLGLYELELLRDAGVRIISIADGIDYPTQDDWLQIQLRFLLNEQPVTDTSKKVRAVIKKSQNRGEWLCAAPYGYIANYNKQRVEVVPDEASVVEEIFRLYNEGWGYKKIANFLTDQNIPTPRMKEKERAENEGKTYKRQTKKEWSIITVSTILSNDFYIGTLRQHKYQRTKINGNDKKLSVEDNIVFEKHHQSIIDDNIFLFTQEQIKIRSKTNYAGIKKYDTPYTGYLYCGDCGSPMFSRSRPDLKPNYVCGAYQKRGRKACTSHFIRVEFLDNMLKDYIRLIKINSTEMLENLENTLFKNDESEKQGFHLIKTLQSKLEYAKEELKATSKQKVKDMLRSTAKDITEQIYIELENELLEKIKGLENQIKLNLDKHNQSVRINRAAKTVFDVFDDILNKDKLTKMDIALIVDRIDVFSNGVIDIKLKSDIEQLLLTGTLPNEDITANFNFGSIEKNFSATYTETIPRRPRKVYTANTISSPEGLLIVLAEDAQVQFIETLLKLARRLKKHDLT